ncbi:MAG: carotenoid biosynthesis protein [Pelolinea sp.]|nr:carotenoid biosynthesis protein [Pelolinea sp.]
MTSFYLYAMEIIVIILFVMCLRHAWRSGPEDTLRLVVGVLFGVLLELATIRQLHAYSYGNFLIMLSDVPLAIGIGWGVIIYSAKLFSDATNLPETLQPMLDGLLALNIDLAMDAIAIRLGMWDWGQGLQFQYFGVPYANFWAWFWVVVIFSAGMRLLTTQARGFWRWLAPFGALFIGLAGILGTNAFIVYIVPKKYYELTIGFPLFSTLLLVLLQKPKRIGQPPALPAFWVPLGFHAYFLAAGLFSGVILDPPILLIVSVGMFTISLYLHRSTCKEIMRTVTLASFRLGKRLKALRKKRVFRSENQKK